MGSVGLDHIVTRLACHHLLPRLDAMVLWHNIQGNKATRNFHLPLPEETYAHLQAEAERMRMPATALARQALDLWLREQLRKARQDAIAAYAAEMAGTHLDLDTELESAAIEHLLTSDKARNEPR
jgi:hypothetical protein